MPPTITCKLTGCVGPAVRAHIIPKCFYRLKYMGKGPWSVMKLGPKPSAQQAQNGVHDSTIVTAEGERHFGHWDTYACKVLVQRKHPVVPWPSGQDVRCLLLPGVDYRSLKLFFISLLWRAAVSSRSLFKGVQLESDQIERLRQMILGADTGSDGEYGVVLGIPRDTPETGFPFMARLVPLADSGVKVAKFYLGWMEAMIKIDARPYPEPLPEFALNPREPARIIITDDFKQTKLCRHIVAEFMKTNHP